LLAEIEVRQKFFFVFERNARGPASVPVMVMLTRQNTEHEHSFLHMKFGEIDQMDSTPCEPQLLHQGTLTLWRQRVNLDLWIVDHGTVGAVEIICYCPDLDKEHRLYVDKEMLLSKMDAALVENALQKSKEESLRQRKDFDEEGVVRALQIEHTVNFIVKRVTVPSDLGDAFRAELRVNFGDKTRHSGEQVILDVVMDERPCDLTPYAVKTHRKIA